MTGRKIDKKLRQWATERQCEYIDAVNSEGGIKPAARLLRISKQTIQQALKDVERKREESENKPLYAGRLEGLKRERIAPPKRGVKRFILTAAQNNTSLHGPFWENLIAFSKAVKAKVMVSTITYNHNSFGKLSVKKGTKKTQDDLWYAPEVVPYIVDHSVEIAPGLVWCGEMNILPTAVNPLSGLETYTGSKSGIFPATKRDMKSVATMKDEAAKFNYTTGVVTHRNYIQKKSGQKAEFHHCYGFLLVEVDKNGDWWVFQVTAGEDGPFYHLDSYSANGVTSFGHAVKAITWGDLHGEIADAEVVEVAWGEGGMMDTLQPKFQFLHDTVDFGRRNHHDTRDCHVQFKKHIEGEEEVETEFQITADLVKDTVHRDWCQTVVVDSNHDNATTRWLREGDYRTDPVNAIYFLTLQKRLYEALRDKEDDFHLVEWALQGKGLPTDIKFLRQDESFTVCGIECGMHGDLGLNGARGSANSLKKMGRKANIGHSHSAGIYDGLWQAGLTAQMEMGYNKGPGSWSHSQIVIYPDGKRCIVTIWAGKWRA